jgi:protein-tyrosine phosphatase
METGTEASVIGHILVVCVGNLCRSPMAEALLAQALNAAGSDVIIRSAGLCAVVGYPPPDVVQTMMRARGIELSGHRARQLTDHLLNEAELVLVMDTAQKKMIEAQAPSAHGKVYRLGEWSQFDVPDPIGQAEHVFEHVLQLIDKGVTDWMQKLKRGVS